tara:strand:+ start:22855 stop:23064 length:210 start_codon:yes stop_codon:yes gene_type:complete
MGLVQLCCIFGNKVAGCGALDARAGDDVPVLLHYLDGGAEWTFSSMVLARLSWGIEEGVGRGRMGVVYV